MNSVSRVTEIRTFIRKLSEEEDEEERAKKLLRSRRQSRGGGAEIRLEVKSAAAEQKQKQEQVGCPPFFRVFCVGRRSTVDRLLMKIFLTRSPETTVSKKVAQKIQVNNLLRNMKTTELEVYSKNPKHLTYLNKISDETKREVNVSLQEQLLNETLSTLLITLDGYRKDLGQNHPGKYSNLNF